VVRGALSKTGARLRLGEAAEPWRVSHHAQRGRPRLHVGKQLFFGRLPLCLFICEQLPQHLVSRLVARRISFGDGDELAVTLDILVLDEALHCASNGPNDAALARN
jgi:hypothetical protein